MNGYEFFLDPVPDDSPSFLVVKKEDKELVRTPLEGISANVTITCSPDGHAFAVTWSDGGGLGIFHVKIFKFTGETFVEVSSASRAFRHFQRQHSCAARGDSIQAYRFVANSSELMLILSVYPTSDCGIELGHIEGYLVRTADGAILRRLNNHALNLYLKRHPEGS